MILALITVFGGSIVDLIYHAKTHNLRKNISLSVSSLKQELKVKIIEDRLFSGRIFLVRCDKLMRSMAPVPRCFRN